LIRDEDGRGMREPAALRCRFGKSLALDVLDRAGAFAWLRPCSARSKCHQPHANNWEE
jgi:hypothetical protein